MPSDTRLSANRVRCRRTPGIGHVESHFLKANSPDGRRALWLKHTAFVPSDRELGSEGEVWAIAFERGRPGFPRGVRSTYPLASVEWSVEPFYVQAPGARLEQGRAAGSAENESHRIGWELDLEGDTPALFPFPWSSMYSGSFPKQKTTTPFPNALATGKVTIDGETWEIAGWPAMQGHNWGRGHADKYAWLHTNLWEAGSHAPAWFEGFCGKVKVGPITTPWLGVAVLQLGDQTFRFDGLRSLLSRGHEIGNDFWNFDLREGGYRLTGAASSDPKAMAGLHYGNPDQTTTYCLNSKLALLNLTLSRPGQPDLQLTSNAAALEIGTKDPRHGVPMLL